MMNSQANRAGLLSILFMGLGQIYNRQFVKGIFFAISELLFLILMLPYISNGFWGLFTLGEKAQSIVKGKIIQGDHSIFLMVTGILSLIILLLMILIYIINVYDARKVGKLRDDGKKVNNIKGSFVHLWEKGFPYIILTPPFLFIVFFTIIPLMFSILIAFTNYSAPNHLPPRNLVEWVGLQTFVDLFQLKTWSSTFYGVALWTIIWAILSTITTFFIGLLFAVLINSKGIKLKKMWRTIYIIPWAVPGFISILMFRNLFNGQFGPINDYLNTIGIADVPWLSDPTLAKVTCLLVNLWFGFPFYMALMSGVLTGISKDLYEAAEVDGANPRQQFWKITLPLVLYATAPLLILGFAGNFNNFTLIYLLTSGGPANAAYSFAGHTDILLSWIYKLTLEQSQFHIASAVTIIIFIFIATLSIYNFRNTRSFKDEDMIQ